MTATKSERFVVAGTWLVSISLVIFALYLGWQLRATEASASEVEVLPSQPTPSPINDTTPVQLPEFRSVPTVQSINPQSDLHTIIPNRPRTDVITYTVDTGDAVFNIAQKFNIAPETVLWANYDQLNDNPDQLSPGMELKIPPIDGVYYQWQEGDTLEDVAGRFKANPKDIMNWAGNKLDLTNPEMWNGQWVLIPGGEREFRAWIVPTIARGKAGVSKSVYGLGACEGSYDGAYGSGAFAWPSANHVLSGNDYWSGHLGIDIAGSTGDGVFASDSGVVVFSGWATGGYGYMIMIDHGNGYQSVYAHLSSVSARCGQSVYQGGYIGAIGSTGNSTGSHLHFEVRYGGGFVSPWYVLPAP